MTSLRGAGWEGLAVALVRSEERHPLHHCRTCAEACRANVQDVTAVRETAREIVATFSGSRHPMIRVIVRVLDVALNR